MCVSTCVFHLVKLPSSDTYWDRVFTRSRSLLWSSRLELIRELETRTERVYHGVNRNPGVLTPGGRQHDNGHRSFRSCFFFYQLPPTKVDGLSLNRDFSLEIFLNPQVDRQRQWHTFTHVYLFVIENAGSSIQKRTIFQVHKCSLHPLEHHCSNNRN